MCLQDIRAAYGHDVIKESVRSCFYEDGNMIGLQFKSIFGEKVPHVLLAFVISMVNQSHIAFSG